MTPTFKNNARGRPPSSNVITFSAPPASMLSQLLMRKRQESKSLDLPKPYEDGQNSKNSPKEENEVINIIIDSDSNDSLDLEKNIDNLENIRDESIETFYSNKDEIQPTEIVHNTSLMFTPVEKEVRCQICFHRSVNYREHKKHLLTHKVNGKFSCESCSYQCNLSCNLIKHARVHRADKPYLCDKCTFRSNFINSLKAHKRIHSGERPYSCNQCDYYCNSISNLKKHTLHRHSKA